MSRLARARGGDFVVDLEEGIATSASSDKTYNLSLDDAHCECPDHRYRGVTCKHLYRALLKANGKVGPSPGAGAAEEAEA